MKNITYAIDNITGLTISRVGSEIAFPVMDYEHQTEHGFETKLEKMSVFEIAHHNDHFTWTKKLPVSLKNYHREFWGMKPLTEGKEES